MRTSCKNMSSCPQFPLETDSEVEVRFSRPPLELQSSSIWFLIACHHPNSWLPRTKDELVRCLFLKGATPTKWYDQFYCVFEYLKTHHDQLTKLHDCISGQTSEKKCQRVLDQLALLKKHAREKSAMDQPMEVKFQMQWSDETTWASPKGQVDFVSRENNSAPELDELMKLPAKSLQDNHSRTFQRYIISVLIYRTEERPEWLQQLDREKNWAQLRRIWNFCS